MGYYSFIDPGRMKAWVGLVGWFLPDKFVHKVVTYSAVSSAQDRNSSPFKTDDLSTVLCRPSTFLFQISLNFLMRKNVNPVKNLRGSFLSPSPWYFFYPFVSLFPCAVVGFRERCELSYGEVWSRYPSTIQSGARTNNSHGELGWKSGGRIPHWSLKAGWGRFHVSREAFAVYTVCMTAFYPQLSANKLGICGQNWQTLYIFTKSLNHFFCKTANNRQEFSGQFLM